MILEPLDPYTDIEDAVLADRSAGPGATLLRRGHEAFRPWYLPLPPTARFLCTPTVLTDLTRPVLGVASLSDGSS